ncbi:MAG: phosphoribosyltransferase [Betaproteobacteria bacterium]|nr:phosphoribosyltransferase [Betaproteobacteria bacterium]
MYFRDRIDAAGQPADALIKWRGHRPLVAAIPRGAVPMGRVIAQRLDGDLDVVLTRKLHAPGNPEFAIGAVDETGWVYVADHAEQAGASSAYLQAQTVAELATIRRRRALYTPNRPPIDPAGRIVIVVDDGLATGATMIAALHALRERKPARLICAVPVASRDAVEEVGRHADEVVALQTPEVFLAVGQFYLTFRQVDDSEVIEVLRAATAGSAPGHAAKDQP